MDFTDWTQIPMSSSQYDEFHALLQEEKEKADKKKRRELERQKEAEKQKDHEEQIKSETKKEPQIDEVDKVDKEQEQLKNFQILALPKVTQGEGDTGKPAPVTKKRHICDMYVNMKWDSSCHTSRPSSPSGSDGSASSRHRNEAICSCQRKVRQQAGEKTHDKQLKRKHSSTSLSSSSSCCRKKRRKRRCTRKKKYSFSIFSFLKKKRCTCSNKKRKKQKRLINLLVPPKCNCPRKKIGTRRKKKNK